MHQRVKIKKQAVFLRFMAVEPSLGPTYIDTILGFVNDVVGSMDGVERFYTPKKDMEVSPNGVKDGLREKVNVFQEGLPAMPKSISDAVREYADFLKSVTGEKCDWENGKVLRMVYDSHGREHEKLVKKIEKRKGIVDSRRGREKEFEDEREGNIGLMDD